MSVDEHGSPRMLHAAGELAPAPAASAMQAARIHVERLASRWGVAPGTLPELAEVGEVSVHGGTIARMRQVIDGLPVWGRELRVLVHPDGGFAMASGTLLGTLTPRSRARFAQDEAAAIASAVAHTYGGRAGIHVDNAHAKRVWYPQDDQLIAAWVVDAYTSAPGTTRDDANRTILAGDTGRVLEHYSLVADAFTYSVFAETTGDRRPLDGPILDSTPYPGNAPNGYYPPYLPGPSQITVDSVSAAGDPWLPPTATETRGNNVDAYVDLSAPGGFSPGDFRATVSAPGSFGYIYDTSLDPMSSRQQQMASITSLFYVINWLHDFWYDAGFTEAAGNAQSINYGRGGVEGDPLLAEAQDDANGGSRNNANMATPDDGMSPRMQVYLWTGRDETSLEMSPSGRTPIVGSASWGPSSFDITAPLVVGVDGAGPNASDGCSALTSAVTGKIVVVDRGNCTVMTKALNIQNAGGIGMVLVNDGTESLPLTMGGDTTVTQPITVAALSVTVTDGAQIKNDIAGGTVTATLRRQQAPELDGSLDSTLIAHEFGHYLHHRLSYCVNKMCEAMSEGWGDFTALLLLARPGDNLDGAFPFSVYSTQSFSADPAYFGIRRAPYSVDPTLNSLSFRHMADGEPLPTNHRLNIRNTNSEVHNAGEVWAEAMWEAYVALQKAGTSFDEVREKMAQYVVAGLLLAPPNASPIEMRDAILAAALTASPADHDVLLAAFARRGFGSCAVAPPADSQSFVGLQESTLVAGTANLAAFTLEDDCDQDGVLDVGETARLKIRVANQGQAALTDLRMTVISAVPGVTVLTPPTTLARLDRLDTTELDIEVKLDGGSTAIAGDLTLSVIATNACDSTISIPVAFRLNVDDVAASSPTDTFDAAASVWESSAWQHIRETPLDGAWHADNLAVVSDAQLTSPLLHASKTERLVVTFQHAYSFDVAYGKGFDGGVIEYSTDDGQTWQDVQALTRPGYSGAIAPDGGNVLASRAAYIAKNPSWPKPDLVTLDFGTALADRDFRLRFRIASDGANGGPGWTIDDVAFHGIVGTPFATEVADDGVCVGDHVDQIVDGGCCDAGPLRGSGLLALGVLGLVLRRRRRSSPQK